MARFDLQYLRERAYFHADLLKGGSVSKTRANDCVNNGLAKLHNRITGLGDDHVVVPKTFSLVADQEAYDLPDNFRRLREIFIVNSDGSRFEIPRFNLKDMGEALTASRHRFSTNADFLRYRIVGQRTIRFYPLPSGTDTIEIWYIPEFQKLVADNNELPEYIAPGWEEYAAVCAAIDMLQHLERDTTTLERREAYLWQEILRDLTPRDQSGPSTITDVERLGRRDRSDWR